MILVVSLWNQHLIIFTDIWQSQLPHWSSFGVNGIPIISEISYCFSTGKISVHYRLFNHNHSFIVEKYKTTHFQNFKKLQTAKNSFPDFHYHYCKQYISELIQCSYSAVTVLIQFTRCSFNSILSETNTVLSLKIFGKTYYLTGN